LATLVKCCDFQKVFKYMQCNLENLSFQELSDMLINKTMELIKSTENADSYAIRDLQIEVENIQEVIRAYWNKRIVDQPAQPSYG